MNDKKVAFFSAYEVYSVLKQLSWVKRFIINIPVCFCTDGHGVSAQQYRKIRDINIEPFNQLPHFRTIVLDLKILHRLKKKTNFCIIH